MFIDKVKIKLKAGNGGSIIFKVDTNKSTLLDLSYAKQIVAKDGVKGKPKRMHGESADDVIVKVPLGTIVKDANTGDLIADLAKVDEEAVICKGGRGGLGNSHFATAKNSAPEYAKMGTEGEYKEVVVELKLLADVGLVGFPSVGKSTLLSMVLKS